MAKQSSDSTPQSGRESSEAPSRSVTQPQNGLHTLAVQKVVGSSPIIRFVLVHRE
jgi:hypothetical protein